MYISVILLGLVPILPEMIMNKGMRNNYLHFVDFVAFSINKKNGHYTHWLHDLDPYS